MEIYVHFIQQLLFFWHFYYTMYHVTFKESNKEHSSAHSDPSGPVLFFSPSLNTCRSETCERAKGGGIGVFFLKGDG